MPTGTQNQDQWALFGFSFSWFGCGGSWRWPVSCRCTVFQLAPVTSRRWDCRDWTGERCREAAHSHSTWCSSWTGSATKALVWVQCWEGRSWWWAVCWDWLRTLPCIFGGQGKVFYRHLPFSASKNRPCRALSYSVWTAGSTSFWKGAGTDRYRSFRIPWPLCWCELGWMRWHLPETTCSGLAPRSRSGSG